MEMEIENKEKTKGNVVASFVNGWTILLIGIVSGIMAFAFRPTTTNAWETGFTIIFPLALLIFFISMAIVVTGFITVRPIEKVIIERLGEYWKILDSGPNILIRGIDKIANTYDIRARKIPLFQEINEDPNKTIDFKDSPEESVDFGVWCVIVDAYRAEYFAADVISFVKDITENIAKRVFGETFVDDAIENKFKVEEATNGYLSKPMEEMAETIDSRYLEILHITREQAKKLSPNMLLKVAGVRITTAYFNDIGLSAPTKRKREARFNTRQDQIITDEQIKVEAKKIEVAEQQKIQQRKKDEGIRLGLEAIAGAKDEPADRKMSISDVAKFKVDMAKYGKGVDQISEINIKGGEESSTDTMVAKLAAIFGKTAQEASGIGAVKKKPEPKEPEEEEE